MKTVKIAKENREDIDMKNKPVAEELKNAEEKAIETINKSTILSAANHEIVSLGGTDSFPPTLEKALHRIKCRVIEYKRLTSLIGAISDDIDEAVSIELEDVADSIIPFYIRKFTIGEGENENYDSELEQVKKSDYYRDFIKRPRCVGKQEKRAGRQECNGEKQSGRNGINNKNDKENPEIQHIRHLLDIIERTIEGELTEQDVIELKQDANNWDEDIKKLKKMIASLNIDFII